MRDILTGAYRSHSYVVSYFDKDMNLIYSTNVLGESIYGYGRISISQVARAGIDFDKMVKVPVYVKIKDEQTNKWQMYQIDITINSPRQKP